MHEEFSTISGAARRDPGSHVSNALHEIEGQRNSSHYGLSSVRFITPVRGGERVRGRFTLKQVTERSASSIQLTVGAVVEIENHDKPALVAEWMTLINT